MRHDGIRAHHSQVRPALSIALVGARCLADNLLGGLPGDDVYYMLEMRWMDGWGGRDSVSERERQRERTSPTLNKQKVVFY